MTGRHEPRRLPPVDRRRARRAAACASALAILLVAPVGAVRAQQKPPASAPQQPPVRFEAKLSTGDTWKPTPEELEQALRKWENEYVVYLITDEERRIFDALPTLEQKLAFTERFWDVRDPTPGTRLNEYRQEHFRRWVTANRRFSAGKPGWSTDRGRIYIILGPPNNIQRNPTGRGGAERASEVWTYNLPDNPLLPGVLDLNFVDFKGTGDYELVNDLDAAAPVVSSQFGYMESPLDVYALRRHADQIYDERFLTYRWNDPTLVAQDFLEFQRNLREILRVPEIHLERLAELRSGRAETDVAFDSVPVSRTFAFFEAVEEMTAVEVAIGIEYDHLTAAPIGLKRHFSADTYVALEQDGAVVAQDEKRLNFTLSDEQLEQLRGTQILQSHELLVPPGRYDLVLMVRDNTGRRLGRRVEQVDVPRLTGDGLRTSSLVLASRIEQIDPSADRAPRDFQHGDLRVVPNIARVYYPDQMVLLYLQVYGIAVDPAANANNVAVWGEIRRDGKRFREIPLQYPAPAPRTRQSLSLGLPLTGYKPGVYQIALTVQDRVAGTQRRIESDFAVLPGSATPTAARR